MEESQKKETPILHDLILAVVNQGHSDDLVNSAREAGASGGTVINTRAQAHEGFISFFDVSEHAEKEIILLLVDRDKKTSIMKILSDTHGLNSEAKGILLSMPVDEVAEMSLGAGDQ